MNREDVAGFFGLIDTYSPGFASKDRLRSLAAVWSAQLHDVDTATATAAVHAHYATETRWIMPADVRRRALTARGLLPPNPEAAYAQARRMNTWLGKRVGPEPEIHPAAMEAAREIRWSTFDGPDGVAHARFVTAYRPLADKATEQALTTPLGELEAAVRAPKALTGGTGAERPLPPADDEPVEPAGPAPTPGELHRQLARVVVAKAPPPPRADYGPPTETQIATATDLFRRWAAENGMPFTPTPTERARQESQA